MELNTRKLNCKYFELDLNLNIKTNLMEFRMVVKFHGSIKIGKKNFDLII